jgi:hypothetical protein
MHLVWFKVMALFVAVGVVFGCFSWWIDSGYGEDSDSIRLTGNIAAKSPGDSVDYGDSAGLSSEIKPVSPERSAVSNANYSGFDKTTPAGRQAYYDTLVRMSPRDIYAGWNDAIARMNPDEISQAAPALGLALRRTGDKAVYREIGDRLLNKAYALVDRLALADTLMFAATPEAIDQIARLLHASEAWTSTPNSADSPENEVLKQSLNTITRSARTLVEGGRNWAISPALESLWAKTTDSTAPQVLNTIATALAYVGKPDGISTLIQSAAQSDTTAARYRIATNVLEHMEFSDGVDAVGAALQQYVTNKNLSRSLVRGLISIGSADSILEVTRYLDRQSDLDSNWLSEVSARLTQRQLSSDAARVLADWKKLH